MRKEMVNVLLYETQTDYLTVQLFHNGDFIPHAHHNMEILVCVTGELCVVCRQQKKVLKPGEMMVAFSHDIHSYLKTGEGEGVMVIVNPRMLPILNSRLQDHRYENFLSGQEALFPSIAMAIYEESIGDRSQEILVGYLYVLLGTALKYLPRCGKPSEISTDTFSRVMEYLTEHYTEPTSLKQLSKRFGVDPCHLSRMFAERLDLGFLKYLHMLRVEHCKNLLRNSDLKMHEIQTRSGFSNQKTFNRVFRELTGMTPSEYQKMD